MDFLDRIEERQRMESFLSAEEGGIACLYGRRRCGKTRLLRELLRNRAGSLLFVADQSAPPLQRARLAADLATILPGFDRVGYPDWGSLLDRWLSESSRGATLVLDEFPYLAKRSPELPSVLQRVADRLAGSGRRLIVCGSSQRMMQGLVLDEASPLHGRCREILHVRPLPFEWTRKAFPGLSPRQRLERWAVWGGVPRYWELDGGRASLEATLRREVFSPLAVLRNEPQFLLLDNTSDPVQAASVLAVVGQGTGRLSEIASRLGVQATELPRPLKRLVALGLLAKESPFGSNPQSGKHSFYRVDDPFLDFWYRFVRPRFSDEAYLSDRTDRNSFRAAFDAYLGIVWERLVRESLTSHPLPGLPGRWIHAARWWGAGTNRKPLEIDVVAESPNGTALLVGECKLSLTPTEFRHEKAELTAKAALLPFAAHYETIHTRIFVGGPAPASAVGISWLDAR